MRTHILSNDSFYWYKNGMGCDSIHKMPFLVKSWDNHEILGQIFEKLGTWNYVETLFIAMFACASSYEKIQTCNLNVVWLLNLQYNTMQQNVDCFAFTVMICATRWWWLQCLKDILVGFVLVCW